MIGILTKRKFFHVGDEDLAIDVAYFVLGQYYGCFGNYSRPIDETVGYSKREVRLEVLYQASIILVHDSLLLGHTMYLIVESL